MHDIKLSLDGDARTFVLTARLPEALARAQRECGLSATEVWRGYSAGSVEAMPDHMLVIHRAEFTAPDELTLEGKIEGPLPS